MKRSRGIVLCPLLCVIVASGCGSGSGGDYSPTPRRRVYPRPRILSQEYFVPESLPLHIEINTGADTLCERRPDGSVWLTVGYPDYAATVYWTLTPVKHKEDVRGVIDNRMERMSLNIGDDRAEIYEFSSQGGFEGAVMKASGVSSTPLQFVGADMNKWVVSGTVWLSSPGVAADSLQPYVDALSRDIARALSSLGVQ